MAEGNKIPGFSLDVDRHRLRELLGKVLRTESDFDAFCTDYFFDVKRRLSAGMDRVSKTNLLLELAEPEAVWNALVKTSPVAVAFILKQTDKHTSEEAKPTADKVSLVFSPSGWPTFTYVEPEQMDDLKTLLLTMGEGLAVEGPSGVGKTTVVEKALQEIGQRQHTRWLNADVTAHLSEIDILADNHRSGHLVVDNFHHLDPVRQRKLAVLIKILSDGNNRDAKVVVIGINPVGQSLIEGHRDIAGRFATISLGRQHDNKILELIEKGESAANIRFAPRQDLVKSANGLFILAQRLCREAVKQAGFRERPAEAQTIQVGIKGIVDSVLRELDPKFRALLIAFASWDESPPPRGACLWLLRKLANSPESMIPLYELRYQDPLLRPAFEWLGASNLGRLFSETPELSTIFHYNRQGAVLSADDPQLTFYLKNVDWNRLAVASGHILDRWDGDKPILVQSAAALPAQLGPTPQLLVGTPEALPAEARSIWVLHLSDLHFGTEKDASLWYGQLEADLRLNMNRRELHAVVLSGDISDRATVGEYKAAGQLVSLLQRGFELRPHQIIAVPGNHDVDWEQSERAYELVRRKFFRQELVEGTYIPIDTKGDFLQVRNEEEYKKRFLRFSSFYEAARGELYPLDYLEQGTLHDLPDFNLLFLGLNSAWNIDHHFRSRASISDAALTRALSTVRNTGEYGKRLKIAVWHHPIHSDAEDRIQDDAFLQQLTQHGFRLALHGHVHRTQTLKYDWNLSSTRRLTIVGAGTFGASPEHQRPSYPHQYQLLEITGTRVTVHTRRREERTGGWMPDARWGDGDPQPRYTLDLG